MMFDWVSLKPLVFSWLSLHWLALYGAVVGTVALIVNFFRYRHVVNKDKIKIVVSVKNHPNREENIQRLKDGVKEWDRPYMVKAYEVTIRNNGSVAAYIEDAGVISKSKVIHPVSISKSHSSTNMGSISSIGQVKIEPKSYEKMYVYYYRDEDIFLVKKPYVIDSTGRKTTGKTIE